VTAASLWKRVKESPGRGALGVAGTGNARTF